MRVTIKGQVTIPQAVRDDMGIKPSKTDVGFVKDSATGRWYLQKIKPTAKSRFRQAHNKATPMMTTDELMALTRQ